MAHLRQQAHNATPREKSVPQPFAASTLSGNIDSQQQWLQQAELDVADAFLDQLDDTPTKTHEVPAKQLEQPAKSSNKCKKSQPWFQLQEQKQQWLDMSEVSSEHSSDESLGESSATSFSDSDFNSKHSNKHKHSTKCKLQSGMFAKHASTIKKAAVMAP